MGVHNELKENQEIIFQELPLPEESDAERAQNMQLFCDNLEMIIANADLIMERPEFFYIRHDWMLIGGIYVGSKHIPLGVLLKLWQSGRWIGECPDCGSRAYIFKAGGSPLSGSHYCHAVCPVCREVLNSKQAETFTVLMKQAFDLCDRYSRKQKILHTRGPVFSWSKGLVGESVPDVILEDVVKPVSLAGMIEALKS
jgi:hypothetical protein